MPVEIAPRVYQLRSVGCRVFALADPNGVTLVDTGWPGSGWLLFRQLRELGIAPGDVTRIVLTHYHIDHRGAAPEVQRATGAGVLIHASEAPYLHGRLPYPNPFQPWPLATLTEPVLKAARGRPLPVAELEDGQRLDVLGGLEVLHTPGHTRGSVALWLPAQGLLLAGDTMTFRWGRLGGPTAHVSEDMPAARQSLERLAALDVETIGFSHFRALRQGARSALERLVATWSTPLR